MLAISPVMTNEARVHLKGPFRAVLAYLPADTTQRLSYNHCKSLFYVLDILL